MPLLAYVLFPTRDSGHFFQQTPRGVLCECCGTCLDVNYVPSNIDVSFGDFELVSTYDNRLICSKKFKERFDTKKYNADDFVQLDSEKELFFVNPMRALAIDRKKTPVRFENKCMVCGNFESVVGPIPTYLSEVESPIDWGFYRSDLEFGSRQAKSPLIITGVKTKKYISDSGIKGVYFTEIEM